MTIPTLRPARAAPSHSYNPRRPETGRTICATFATIRDRRCETGAGSAVTFTDDGFLLTNAHVVAGASGGTAAFADGTETRFDVAGADAPPVIGTDLPITVLRKNAFVDVVTVPAELS